MKKTLNWIIRNDGNQRVAWQFVYIPNKCALYLSAFYVLTDGKFSCVWQERIVASQFSKFLPKVDYAKVTIPDGVLMLAKEDALADIPLTIPCGDKVILPEEQKEFALSFLKSNINFLDFARAGEDYV